MEFKSLTNIESSFKRIRLMLAGFACCCVLYRRWAKKLPDVALPYAVRLAQRALEQADYGLWQLQGRLFQLIN